MVRVQELSFSFNNKKLFSNDNWNQVDGLHDNPHRHGVEMYFGHVFERKIKI